MTPRTAILALTCMLLLGCDSRQPPTPAPPAPPPKTPSAASPSPGIPLSELSGRLAAFTCDRAAACVRVDVPPDLPIQDLVSTLDALRQARFEQFAFVRLAPLNPAAPVTGPGAGPEEGGPVQLPATAAASRLEPEAEAVVVSLGRDGSLRDAEARPIASAREFAEGLGPRRPVVVRADRRAAWRHAAHLLEACAQARVHRLSLAALDSAGRPTVLPIPLPREHDSAPCAHRPGPPIPRLGLSLSAGKPLCAVEPVPACGLCSAALAPDADRDLDPELERTPSSVSFGPDPDAEAPVFRAPAEFVETESDDSTAGGLKSGDWGDLSIGAGLPGPYDRRTAGRRMAVASGGGSPGTENAVLLALRWLARHQDRVGRWTAAGYLDQCGKTGSGKGARCEPHGLTSAEESAGGDVEAFLTGLTALAFLGAGHTPASEETHDARRFGEVLGQAIQYLERTQDPDGCVGALPRRGPRHMLAHAVAATALFECSAMHKDAPAKGTLERALRFLSAGQARDGGWGYTAAAEAGNATATAWALLAIRAAELAGFPIDPAMRASARGWLERVTEKTKEGAWRARHQVGAEGDPGAPAAPKGAQEHDTAAALGIVCRLLTGTPRSDPAVLGPAAALIKDLPSGKPEAVDQAHWHFATQALFLHDAPRGAGWKAWNTDLAFTLIQSQQKGDAGDRCGSWEPAGRWSGLGGRVFATALNALTLESYYRIPPPAGR